MVQKASWFPFCFSRCSASAAWRTSTWPDKTGKGKDEANASPYKTLPWKEQTGPIDVPFIFWGGDVATFHANGGLETKADSIFGKQGLKIKLTPGDDFDKQVEQYLGAKSPFLRGTL